jgi:hypothetical protein
MKIKYKCFTTYDGVNAPIKRKFFQRKWKNGVFVFFAHDCVADWELCLVPAQHEERVVSHIVSPGKD